MSRWINHWMLWHKTYGYLRSHTALLPLNTHPSNGPFSGTTQVSRYQKVKPIWILLKQETVSGSGISYAICKSAPCSRQITIPAPHQSVFKGRMPFLPPNQQCQSTEGSLLPLTGTKLYCLVTEARVLTTCPRLLAESGMAGSQTCNFVLQVQCPNHYIIRLQ